MATATRIEVQTVRSALGLTQDDLGRILGVHPLTISKWERGVATPDPENSAIIQLLLPWTAARVADLGGTIRGLLHAHGALAARGHLLITITDAVPAAAAPTADKEGTP